MQCSVPPHPLPFGFWSSELKTTPEHVMVFVSTLFCIYGCVCHWADSLKLLGGSPASSCEVTPNLNLIFVLLFPARITWQLLLLVSVLTLYLRHRLHVLWVFSATFFNLILPVLNNFVSIANYSCAIHLHFQIAYE